ncbi:uncharacterized protein K02A2.6-like [Mercenaria mercenaria]|uniref:uncharacterized protein K02A2.6-like n=1 Tax=Mercenaria mercenaria TaxID=6596 RepID=UPI00234EEBA1|nr:uncharacterized protein K02A2.6-like [Mercenaria mercenaria]
MVLMKQRLRSKLWRPGMDKDIEKFCKECYSCQLVGQSQKSEPMKRRELPSQPWEHLSADFLGPLPSGHNLLVIVDYYSRWVEIFVLKTITSYKIIQCFKRLFAVHGLPIAIQTDNAQNFNSRELNKLDSSDAHDQNKSVKSSSQLETSFSEENIESSFENVENSHENGENSDSVISGERELLGPVRVKSASLVLHGTMPFAKISLIACMTDWEMTRAWGFRNA